jgi:hypothetical protein
VSRFVPGLEGASFVDTREPHDGDFASYVERITKQPAVKPQVAPAAAKVAPPPGKPARVAAVTTATANSGPPTAALGQILSTVGGFVLLAGIFLFAHGSLVRNNKAEYFIAAAAFFAGNAMRKQGASMRASS